MEIWGASPINGRPAHLFTLTNRNGMTAKITDYGATVISLTAPERSNASKPTPRMSTRWLPDAGDGERRGP